MILRNARIWTGTAGAPILHGSIHLGGDRILRLEEGAGPSAGQDLGQGADLGSDLGAGIDLGGRLVTPALIDCHTHLVHGGNRADEWAMRLEGAGYEAIARAGGGIMSTVRVTRAESSDALRASARRRLDLLASEGIATVEVKSGYGLSVESELAMLRVARALDGYRGIKIKTSYLGAHALPPEFAGRKDDYLDQVCLPALHQAHAEGLVDAVDGFCEGIAFSVAEITRVFEAAQALGLPVKLHAEQLSHLGGTRLAARFGALSADHLEYADEEDARAMAASGTVAVLLPGAYYVLREKKAPPVAALRAHGVPMAVATDLNPGTSPVHSLLLSLHLACTLFGLTVEEALLGATAHAARALGLADRGRIAPGLRADLAVWDAQSPAELIGGIGISRLNRRIIGGQEC